MLCFFRHYQLVTASVEGSHKKTSSIKLDLDVVKRLFTNTTSTNNTKYLAMVFLGNTQPAKLGSRSAKVNQ